MRRSAPDQEPRAPTDDPYWLLMQVARGIHVKLDEVVREHGIGLRAQVVLAEIARVPDSCQLELARSVAIDKSSLVAVLDELEAARLIQRKADAKDRRTKRLQPTAKGLTALRTTTRAIERVMDSVFADVPAHERNTFLSVLRRLATGQLAVAVGNTPCDET
jgi:MarR family transcriptional regulator, transcriptional regulator for hemolysin